MTPAAWRAPRAQRPAASPRSPLRSRPGASVCLRGGRNTALTKQRCSATCARRPPPACAQAAARPTAPGHAQLALAASGRCSAAQRYDNCQEAAGLRWWHACFWPEPACAGMMRGPCLACAALQHKQAVPARRLQPGAASHTRHVCQAACEQLHGSSEENALTQSRHARCASRRVLTAR